MEKYIQMAKKAGMIDAIPITSDDVYFDVRAILKCRWGCGYNTDNPRCSMRDTGYSERIEMIKSYKNILLIHSNDAQAISKVALKIERAAFLDGHYFASAVAACNLCKECKIRQGKPCISPNKIRPCELSSGIDVYRTVRKFGLPCNVLQKKTDVENRYGFVLID
jgi:predicted metal-binding protein